MDTRIALFQKKEIRKTLHGDQWWFVIVDVVAALTDSVNPTSYLKDMRRRDPVLADALKGGANCPISVNLPML
jgi:prophage antirepressor-like protein